MSRLRGKTREKRHAAQKGYENSTAAEVAEVKVTDTTNVGGTAVSCPVLTAETYEGTRSGAWDWATIRERLRINTGATCFNEVFQYHLPNGKPPRKRLTKREYRTPSSTKFGAQAIEQLQSSGLARIYWTEFENHLTLRAPES